MTCYQIRTPRNLAFESILQEMGDEAWKATQDLMDPQSVSGLSLSSYRRAIKSAISPYLKKYDRCNHFPECSDEVEGAPWLDSTDRVCLLMLPKGLDVFLDDFTFEVLQDSKPLFRSGHARETFRRLRGVFRRGICRYLYFNPICRVAPICQKSVEVNPWEPERLQTIA